MRYRPYIPQTLGELMDHLGSMMLGAPTFKDKTEYFPQMNIDTEFFALNEGLLAIRKKLGEERYAALKALSDNGPGRTVIDGPFAATSELVAGFWLWDVKDLDEAVAWVKRCPNPMPGPSEIEIRPLYEMADLR